MNNKELYQIFRCLSPNLDECDKNLYERDEKKMAKKKTFSENKFSKGDWVAWSNQGHTIGFNLAIKESAFPLN